MVVGVSGSRYGPISDIQSHNLKMVLKGCMGHENELKHGACIGVDEETVMVAHDMGYTCTAFPPINKAFVSEVALMLSIEIRPEAEYLDRNKDIVNEVEKMIIVPSEFEEKIRSGTWSTYRYAKRQQIPLVIIYPDGSMKEENV